MLRSDLDLKTQVNLELANDASCSSAAIEVAVRNGVVTLSGSIADSHIAHAAVCAVKRVFGVEAVEARFGSGGSLAAASAGSPTL